MRVQLENIGVIKKADIELNGLTVLTGVNAVGKSFVGKSIYSVVKSIKDSNILFLEQVNTYISDRTRELYIDIRGFFREKNISTNSNSIIKIGEVEEIFESYIYKTVIDEIKDPKTINLIKKETDELIDNYLSKTKQRIDSIFAKENSLFEIDRSFGDEIISKLKNGLDDIKNLIYNPTLSDKKYIVAFDSLVTDIFKNEIVNMNSEAGKIEFYEGALHLISIVIDKNKGTEFKGTDLVLKFQDCILVESPLYINLVTLISRRYLGFLQRNTSQFPHYIDDLLKKLIIEDENNKKIATIEQINKLIKQTIGGEMFYDEEDNALKFENHLKHIIKVDNLASGIKSFSMIKLLINTGNLNKDSLLIIDEPEVHLHPQWVVEYARLIVLLVENNINVLLSTHSYYMIQSLRKFMSNIKKENLFNLYWGETIEGMTEFQNVNENMEIVFKKLVESYQKISK